MSASNSTRPTTTKPERPQGSPLFWHASGRWAKKIRGKQRYFGRGSHEDALAEYERQKDDLHAGRQPDTLPDTCQGITMSRLVGKFLTSKQRLLDSGELSIHSYHDYEKTGQLLVS